MADSDVPDYYGEAWGRDELATECYRLRGLLEARAAELATERAEVARLRAIVAGLNGEGLS